MIKYPIGTKVELIKDVPQNSAFVGDRGVIEHNSCIEFSYGLRMKDGSYLPVYSTEFKMYLEPNEVPMADYLTVL